MVLYCCYKGYISKQIGILLIDEYTLKHPDFIYNIDRRFDLSMVEENKCRYEFRIDKKDILRLADVLGLPASFKCTQQSIRENLEAYVCCSGEQHIFVD